MKRNITISKAKLKKGIYLEVTYSEQQTDGMVDITQKGSAEVHQDMRDAFKLLAPHLGQLAEQFGKDGKITENLVCRSFSIRGEDDNEGVTLTGLRSMSNGSTITLNAPFLKFSSESYGDQAGLHEALEKVRFEIEEYLFNNKHNPNPQGELFPDDDEED